MNYFVTGATGFIGTQFLDKLLRRDGKIYILVREQSLHKVADLRYQLRARDDEIIPVTGDLAQPLLGLDSTDIDMLNNNIDAFFHLGAIYDIAADEESQLRANVDGTRHAMHLAEKINAGCFHHTSSIAVAGLYEGTFTEDMFAEAVGVDANPYLKTKHVSEGVVRDECKIPYRIYRPAVVVGHSKTGQIDKIDGPYYFFELIDRVSQVLPRWTPLPIIKGAPFNLVPVDFVVDAMDHIAHQPGLDGQCFHLTDPKPSSIGTVFNQFLKAAKGPTMTLDLPQTRIKELIPVGVRMFIEDKKTMNLFKERLLENYNIPKQMTIMEGMKTNYDCSNTLRALEGSGITVLPLKEYAAILWSYWERNLHPKLSLPQNLEQAVNGKVAVITGGSEGIGKQVGADFAAAGATVILVARKINKLNAAVDNIKAAGGDAHGYRCDLTDMEACDQLIAKILDDFGHIDILVNNAGRSIRRSLVNSYDRFHDFERVMQLNFFAAIRLILAVLPSMTRRQQGKIINVSSIAAMSQSSARFSAYTASKVALDSWSKSAAIEFMDKNIKFTNVHMPLVRTKMIAATGSYKSVPALTPQQAGELIIDAVVNSPSEVNTITGEIMRLLANYAPVLYNLMMGTTYQITEDSAAALAGVGKTKKASAVVEDAHTLESVAKVLKGVHS